MDGENDTRRAIVSGDSDSRIDFDISGAGILNADYFTMSYPTAAGFKISSSGTQVISYGNFDGPSGSSGVLLDLSGTGTLSSAEVTGCNFNNTGLSGTDGINVKADASTQAVTFTSYGGTLASNATVAEANDSDNGDPGDKIFFFNNQFYSHNNNNPNTAGNWYSATNGTGINPSDFTNANHEFIVQSGDTYTATADWTVAGRVQIVGELSTGAYTTTVGDHSQINGTLTIPTGGVYDADGTVNASSGDITIAGTGRLRLSNTVFSLGSNLTTGAGTVEYDGGTQTVFADTYYNLEIDQAGTKTAGGAVNVNGTMTVQSAATYDIAATTTTVTGTSTIAGTLDIDGSGVFDANGTFTASGGDINFDGAGFLKCASTVSSLGTLSTDAGTVIYDQNDGQLQDVISDTYYNLTFDGDQINRMTSGSINVNGNLAVNGTNTFFVDSYSATVTGTTDIDGLLTIGSGTFTANGPTDVDGTLRIAGIGGEYDANGTFTAASGNVTFAAAGFLRCSNTVTDLGDLSIDNGTVEYDGGTQDIFTDTYYNLEIDQSGTKESQGNLTIKNNLTITAGALDIGTNSNNLTIGGNFTNSSTFTTSGETVTFDGSTENTSSLISDATVDLIINKSGSGGITFGGNSSFDNVTVTDGYLDIGPYTFTADNTISIASVGKLKIPNSGTFNADGQLSTHADGEIDFTGTGSQGDLICSSTSANTFGTLDAAAGTVTFDGSSSQALDDVTFFNVTNSNSSGLTMSGNATVNGELNLNVAADITTGANTLTIGTGGSIANAADDRHINVDNTSGYLAKTFGSATDFSYPVGNGTILRPIKLTTNAGSTTFKLRYDDNRYSSGNVTGGGFASGHISGFDGSNTDVTKGYYYDIQKTSGSANAKLYVNWTSEDDYGTGGNVLNPNLTGIAWGFWDGSKWDDIPSSTAGGISTGNITTNDFVTTWSNDFFTLGSTDGENNLPIDLVSFGGECIDNQTNLEFVVASQVNNEYFTIERSKNLLSWEKLGDIVGGGTNNEEITYSFKDISPNSGDNYYRLSQTDIDGISKSFSPIAVTCESKVENYNIYPNPTTNRIAVEFELEFYQGDDIELVIRDFKGSIVKSNSIELNRGYNYFEVDLTDIPNGIYTVEYLGTKNHIPLRRVIKL